MARSPKRKTDDAVTTAADGAPKALPQPGTVTNSDIARRAYELYLGRGCEHGHDVDDWTQAERELQSDPEC
jgi:Protein of unknown function (DUF2934)